MGQATVVPRFELRIEPDTPWVTLASGRGIVPEHFQVTVGELLDESVDPVVDIELAVEGGRVVCLGVQFRRRPGGRAVQSTDLGTLPLKHLIRDAALPFAHLRFSPDGSLDLSPPDLIQTGAFERVRADQKEREEIQNEIKKAIDQHEHSRGRAAVTDEHLAEVAKVYREAAAAGQPPTQAVAIHFERARSTAGRWVVQARQAGHLRPARGDRQAGEAPSDSE